MFLLCLLSVSNVLAYSEEPRYGSILTNDAGRPIYSPNESLTAYDRGPIILHDMNLVEKLAHFNGERIPERTVHAKGSGAFGSFRVTHDVSQYVGAHFLSEIGLETELAVRFSTGAGGIESADTLRDPRGFALKFYTEEGNLDFAGQHHQVFFIRDPALFPDMIHARRPDPVRGYPVASRLFDFWSQHPESLSFVSWVLSDHGTPDGYRYMDGFAVHTYLTTGKTGEKYLVKFGWFSQQGIKTLGIEKAVQLAGMDPFYSGRDLFESIKNGDYPKWTFKIQAMPLSDADSYKWDPMDPTKQWDKNDYPWITAGEIVFNKNPRSYFNEVEQMAFSPGSLVPGIEASNDLVLQGRMFAYADALRYRLGRNFMEIPVNCPMRSSNPVSRDGLMQYGMDYDRDEEIMTYNDSKADNYYPNRKTEITGPMLAGESSKVNTLGFADHCEVKDKIDRKKQIDEGIDYEALSWVYNQFTPKEKEGLCYNISLIWRNIDINVRNRLLNHIKKADIDYFNCINRYSRWEGSNSYNGKGRTSSHQSETGGRTSGRGNGRGKGRGNGRGKGRRRKRNRRNGNSSRWGTDGLRNY